MKKAVYFKEKRLERDDGFKVKYCYFLFLTFTWTFHERNQAYGVKFMKSSTSGLVEFIWMGVWITASNTFYLSKLQIKKIV